MAANYQKGVL